MEELVSLPQLTAAQAAELEYLALSRYEPEWGETAWLCLNCGAQTADRRELVHLQTCDEPFPWAAAWEPPPSAPMKLPQGAQS